MMPCDIIIIITVHHYHQSCIEPPTWLYLVSYLVSMSVVMATQHTVHRAGQSTHACLGKISQCSHTENHVKVVTHSHDL